MTHNILIYTIPNTELLVPSSAVFSLNLENCYRKARHRYRSAQAFNAFGSAMKLREPKTARLNLNVFFGGMEILPVLVQVFQNLSKDEEEPFLTQVNIYCLGFLQRLLFFVVGISRDWLYQQQGPVRF